MGALIGDKGIIKKTKRYGHYKGYDLSKYHRYVITVCLGNDFEWGRHISDLIFRTYRLRGSVYHDGREWVFTSSSSRIFSDLSQYYKPVWNARTWRIAPILFRSSPQIRHSLIRGYFDADGYPHFSEARRQVLVQANSVNKNGLTDMRRLLWSIGYNPGLYKRYKNRDVWELSIIRKSEVLRFFKQISFSIERKQRKLEHMLRRKGQSFEK